MDQERFRDRVLAFAAGAGATVLILSLLALGATLEGIEHGRSAVLPLSAALLAVISATITAVATFQALAPVAQALDEIIDQVATVAAGELKLSFSRVTRQHLPRLADSLDIMTSKVRSSIDNIDAALVFMLAERFKITQAVGEYKATHALPPADPTRETRSPTGRTRPPVTAAADIATKIQSNIH